MRKIELFKQSPGLCGPYALQAVVSNWNKSHDIRRKPDASELVRLTKATEEDGCGWEGMVHASRSLGFNVTRITDATSRDLKGVLDRHLFPIVCIDDPAYDLESHWIIIGEVYNGNLVFGDPKIAEFRTLPRNLFLDCWYATEKTSCNGLYDVSETILVEPGKHMRERAVDLMKR